MRKNELQNFLALVSDVSITDDAWGDVFVLTGHEMMNKITQNFDNETIQKAYSELKNTKSRFKFMQIWSQVEDFKNLRFFMDQISDHDVETSEIIFDNLRNWGLDKKGKLELLEAIKKVSQKSKLLNVTIEKLSA